MGELAQRKSNNESVRRFGKKMVNEHLLTNEKLRVAASETGIFVPVTMSGMQRKNYDRLSRLTGSKFDTAYMQMQVSDYKSIVKHYKREAKEESPSRVREFALQTLLALEQHLTEAEDIKQQLLQEDKTS